jgi:putative ABC transport system permease protein
MELKEILKSAFQALRNNALRTSLTMLGIIIGVTAVILIYSIGQGAVAFITNELASFGTDYFQINPGGSQFSTFAGSKSLTFEDMEAIKNDTSLSNIKSVAPISMASVPISTQEEEKELLVYGITTEIQEILRPEIVDGEFITDEHEESSERVAVIGSEAAEDFFGENPQPIGESIRIDGKTFRIIGLTSSSSVIAGGFINNSLFVPINIVTDEILGEERLMEIDISVHNPGAINQTVDEVEALLRERHELDENDENDFQIQSAQDILSTVQTITGLLTAMIVGISGISLIVGGVGVMNIMLVSVTERTKEIGLLKAIGAKKSDILNQFLAEAVVMTLIGGLVGIALGILGAFSVSLLFGIPFIVSIPAILIAVGVSSLVGIIFGIYPARRAANLSPIDALRYE